MSDDTRSTSTIRTRNRSCRFCFTKNTLLVNIYKDCGSIGKPLNKIKSCTPSHVKSIDPLNTSRFICFKCLAFVDEMEKFWLRAKNANLGTVETPKISGVSKLLAYSPGAQSIISKKNRGPCYSQENVSCEKVVVEPTSHSQGCIGQATKQNLLPEEKQELRLLESQKPANKAAESSSALVKACKKSPIKRSPLKLTVMKGSQEKLKITRRFVKKSSPDSSSVDLVSGNYCHLCQTRFPMEANMFKHVFDVHDMP